jgi:hypothetical protein
LGNYARRTGERIWWLFIVILSVLGFYTIPIMLYPFGVFVIWLLMSVVFDKEKPDRVIFIKRLIVSCVFTVILTVLLYIPVFAVSGVGSVVANRFVTALPWQAFFDVLLHSLRLVWSYWNRDIPLLLEYIFVVGFFISLIFHKRIRKDNHFPIVLSAPILLIPLLLLQRVVPFTRIWLFLLPLYLGVAASGIRYILQPLKKYMGSYMTHIFVVLAICLSISLGINVIRTQSVYYSNETGTMRDAKDITMYLKAILKPDDRVLADGPSYDVLVYYFELHNAPTNNINKKVSDSVRIFIIVNKAEGQTLEGVVKKFVERENQVVFDFSIPRLISEYEFSSLYEMTRKR